MFPHPQATSTDHGGPRTSDHSRERRRRNDFTAAPLNTIIKNFVGRIYDMTIIEIYLCSVWADWKNLSWMITSKTSLTWLNRDFDFKFFFWAGAIIEKSWLSFLALC